MQSGCLHCPTCGAATASDATACPYCGTRLATVQCDKCFGMLFVGSKFCPHCGAPAAARHATDDVKLFCPRCKSGERRRLMEPCVLNRTHLDECPICSGIWIDHSTFRLICTRADVQADALSILGAAKGSAERTVQYLRCPLCNEQMARKNYARRSGVIMDICNSHGLWFDRDELRNVIEFIRTGGLVEAARADAERIRAEAERKELERQTLGNDEAANRENDGVVSFSSGMLIAQLLRLMRHR